MLTKDMQAGDAIIHGYLMSTVDLLLERLKKAPTCFKKYSESTREQKVSRNCGSCDYLHQCSDCSSQADIDKLLQGISDFDGNGEMRDIERNNFQEEIISLSTEPTAGEKSAEPSDIYELALRHALGHKRKTNIQLAEELSTLMRELASSTYLSLRPALLSLHLEMNFRQQQAPRFRPQVPLPKVASTEADTLVLIDRQIIDLHWRAHSLDKPSAEIRAFPGIFDCSPFNFSRAEEFARKPWKAMTKSIQLLLTEDMQWEHCTIQTSAVRDKWRVIESGDVRGSTIKQKGANHVEMAIRQNMSNRPHLRKHIPSLVHTWKALRICGDSPTRISRMLALMTGESPRDASAVKRSIKALQDHLKA